MREKGGVRKGRGGGIRLGPVQEEGAQREKGWLQGVRGRLLRKFWGPRLRGAVGFPDLGVPGASRGKKVFLFTWQEHGEVERNSRTYRHFQRQRRDQAYVSPGCSSLRSWALGLQPERSEPQGKAQHSRAPICMDKVLGLGASGVRPDYLTGPHRLAAAAELLTSDLTHQSLHRAKL